MIPTPQQPAVFPIPCHIQEVCSLLTLLHTRQTQMPKVRGIYVSEGDQVKEGDSLIRLSNGTTYEAEFDGKVSSIDVLPMQKPHPLGQANEPSFSMTCLESEPMMLNSCMM